MLGQLAQKNDSNVVIINFNNEKEGKVYPTKESILKAVADVRAEKLEAYVDNVKDEPIMTIMPKKGIPSLFILPQT